MKRPILYCLPMFHKQALWLLWVDFSSEHIYFETLLYMSCVMRKLDFAYAKTKAQISFAVTAKLISAFVFATHIVLFLFFLNTKFQASSHTLWLHRPVCVGPGRKHRRPVFSRLATTTTDRKTDSLRSCYLLLVLNLKFFSISNCLKSALCRKFCRSMKLKQNSNNHAKHYHKMLNSQSQNLSAAIHIWYLKMKKKQLFMKKILNTIT